VRRGSVFVVVAIFATLLVGTGSAAARPASVGSDATYFNNAAFAAADPYVLHDPRSGYYYAYSTEGADQGYYFAIYRSADLVTWHKAAPGALPVHDPNQWGTAWFWAPETYYNPRTRLYFLFYAAKSEPNSRRGSGTQTSKSHARSAWPCHGRRPARFTTSPITRSTTAHTTRITTT
jgi:hypothetical protein